MKNKVLLTLLDRIQKIEDRIKRLEQAQTYFPLEDPITITGGVGNIRMYPAAVDYVVDYKEGEE